MTPLLYPKRMTQISSFGPTDLDQPPRTSILAVLSLICGIVCIPGLGVLAVLFAVGALVGIGGSAGRKKGKGLAITGLLLGLVASVGWGLTAWGFSAMMKIMKNAGVAVVDRTFAAVEAGDWDGARGELSPGAATLATDEVLADFRSRYQDAVGTYSGSPQGGWMEFFQAYGEIQPAMQSYSQRHGGFQNAFPMPIRFDSGSALVIAVIDQRGGATQMPVGNIVVVKPDGTEIHLFPPGP